MVMQTRAALMLETQAVTMSTSRSAIIGSENAATAKVSAANIEPTAEPIARRNAATTPSKRRTADPGTG